MAYFSLHTSQLIETMTMQFNFWMDINVKNTMLKGFFKVLFICQDTNTWKSVRIKSPNS